MKPIGKGSKTCPTDRLLPFFFGGDYSRIREKIALKKAEGDLVSGSSISFFQGIAW